jgi:hypothetical protein
VLGAVVVVLATVAVLLALLWAFQRRLIYLPFLPKWRQSRRCSPPRGR